MASTSTGADGGDQFFYTVVPGITKSGLTKSGKVKVKLNNEEIVLIPYKGQIHAVQAKCPHQGGPLENGEIEDLGSSVCIKCPWHSYKFSVITGACVHPDPNRKLAVYPVQINNEEIKVGFRKAPPK